MQYFVTNASSGGFSLGSCSATLSVLPSRTGCWVEKSLLCGTLSPEAQEKHQDPFLGPHQELNPLGPNQGWLSNKNKLFAALWFCDSLLQEQRPSISPGEVGWNESAWERPWGQPEIGLLFSFYLSKRDIKRNILLFLTPNSQWRQKESQVTIA